MLSDSSHTPKSKETLVEFYQFMCTGTRLVIEIDSKITNEKIKAMSLFLGYKDNNLFMIDFPSVNSAVNSSASSADNNDHSIIQHVREFDDVVIKAVAQTEFKEIVAFKTKIQAVIYHPEQRLILAIPDEIQVHKVRQTPRIDVRVAAHILIDGRSYPAIMKDYSITGALLSIDREDINLTFSAHAGDKIEMSFTNPLGVWQTFSAEIIRLSETYHSIAVSMQFTDHKNDPNYEEAMEEKRMLFNQFFIQKRHYYDLN